MKFSPLCPTWPEPCRECGAIDVVPSGYVNGSPERGFLCHCTVCRACGNVLVQDLTLLRYRALGDPLEGEGMLVPDLAAPRRFIRMPWYELHEITARWLERASRLFPKAVRETTLAAARAEVVAFFEGRRSIPAGSVPSMEASAALIEGHLRGLAMSASDDHGSIGVTIEPSMLQRITPRCTCDLVEARLPVDLWSIKFDPRCPLPLPIMRWSGAWRPA